MLQLLVALSLTGGCKQQRELSDTLAWMDNTYNEHHDVLGSYGHGHTGWYLKGENGQADKLVIGHDQSFTHRGCEMTITINENRNSDVGDQKLTDDTILYNLRDLNPDSIKVTPFSHYGGFGCQEYSPEERSQRDMTCDWAEITVKTHNEAPLVQVHSHSIFPKLSGKDHDLTTETKDNDTYFEVNDVEYAQQFAKAFRHAIELCGGTPQSF